MDIKPGSEFAGFRLEGQIGEGGMGVVYRARQLDLERTVALKLIRPAKQGDRELTRRFQRESRLAASIDHPNVIPIFQADEVEGIYFIAMRYVEGTDLEEELRRRRPIPATRATDIGAQVASALDAAHAAGLVHRDVKPANILLDGDDHAYLTDFGITKQLSSTSFQTKSGSWYGALSYAAPEQVKNAPLDARTDVYALGCVLFECLTGELPFVADSDAGVMFAKLNEEPRSASHITPGLPPRLDQVLGRALAREPNDRYPSAGDLGRAAMAAAARQEVSEPERTVARGAALDPTEPMGSAAPAPSATPPAWSVSETRQLPQARDDGEKSWTGCWLLAGAGAIALTAIGALAAVALLGNTNSTNRTEVRRLATTITEKVKPAPGSSPGTSSGGGGAAEASKAPSSSEPELPPSSVNPATEPFAGRLYSAEVPAEWIPEKLDEAINGRYESIWREPSDPNTSILIDAQIENSGQSAMESAEIVRAQTSQTPGYEELAFEPTTLAGVPAAWWVFDVENDRRVDYFFVECNVGMAVLGSTSHSNFPAWEPLFQRVAESTTARC